VTRAGHGGAIPFAVGAYIGAAYRFTSSTSFANPAVTLGRAFSDLFAGISPASVPGFVVAQLLGAAAASPCTRPVVLTTRHPRSPKPNTSQWGAQPSGRGTA
jgi:glycerol uptake facilitator-like aquaporin